MRRKIKRNLRIARLVARKEMFVDSKEHLWTFVGSFVGISLIGWLNNSLLNLTDNLFLIGSFGASSVLIYGALYSPLAQPRNLIGGHIISALIGVTISQYFPGEIWFKAGLSVSVSIVAMQITKTLHPPGGATALIAVIGSDQIQRLGYFYVLSPIMTGITILLAVALLVNNVTSQRSYPMNKQWYKIWKRKYLRNALTTIEHEKRSNEKAAK